MSKTVELCSRAKMYCGVSLNYPSPLKLISAAPHESHSDQHKYNIAGVSIGYRSDATKNGHNG